MTFEETVSTWNENQQNMLDNIFSIGYIYNTNSIENIQLSYHQTKQIFESETVSNYNGDVRDLFLVLNAKETIKFIKSNLAKQTPITVNFIKELHRVVMKGSFNKHLYSDNGERPGEFKKHHYVIGKTNQGALPEDVESQLDELLTFILCRTNDGKNIFKLATVLHCEFELIHPFADGNGRTGRWLMNYYLMLHNYPPLIVFDSDKWKYYECFDEYALKKNPVAMYDFLKDQCIKTYEGHSFDLETTNEFLDD